MDLQLRSKEECKYDAVSLGEVMLRLDPGEGRIRTARSFRAWEGGGEYNVVRGLRRCFGMNTAVITAFAENEVGMLMEDFILQGGVDTALIHWMKTDGTESILQSGDLESEARSDAQTVRTRPSPRRGRRILILNIFSESLAFAGCTRAASMRLFPNNPAKRFWRRSGLPRNTGRSYLMT